MATYKIVRFYQGNKAKHTVRGRTGLTLEQAQAHCSDSESRYKTCITRTAKARTKRFGPWFEGFYKER